MYTLTINGATYPKVTEFKITESKLGRRFKTKQLNGVEYSILVSEINKLEIEREENGNKKHISRFK